ncbi:unnamed protein product [Clonostachys rosea]|uniref:F-box domain-containing protein n=1 Tax=Bionectria ochroleuca TaxID=29856 RepID=A0ABY6UKQ9_BIOOC|nr:unnamed protein product [Clonostachys rosea]
MSLADQPPLLRLPLHTVTHILSHLSTIKDLGPAILSHSIFRDAFEENRHLVAGAIVTRQTPDGTLRFLVALLQSKKLWPQHIGAAENLLAYIVSPHPVALRAFNLPMSDYAFMSRSCSYAETICKHMALELLRLQYRTPGTPKRSEATPEEKFRIYRAVFRYQIMCNMFCHRMDYKRTLERLPRFQDEELKRLFFSSFSPWVNEELMCVFIYMRRKVTQGPDVDFISQIHWMLCLGLRFLSKVASGMSLWRTRYPYFSIGRPAARAYNPRTILSYSRLTPEHLNLNPPLPETDPALNKWSSEQISQLDPQRGLQTSSFSAWKAAHLTSPISQTVCCETDMNLWFVGYAIWSAPGASIPLLQRIYDDLRRREATFPRLGDAVDRDDLWQSREMRFDIFKLGGRGYWPRADWDWSQIWDLTEEEEIRLTGKWRRQGIPIRCCYTVTVKKRAGDDHDRDSKRRATMNSTG